MAEAVVVLPRQVPEPAVLLVQMLVAQERKIV
jgi:hypothetical protein